MTGASETSTCHDSDFVVSRRDRDTSRLSCKECGVETCSVKVTAPLDEPLFLKSKGISIWGGPPILGNYHVRPVGILDKAVQDQMTPHLRKPAAGIGCSATRRHIDAAAPCRMRENCEDCFEELPSKTAASKAAHV